MERMMAIDPDIDRMARHLLAKHGARATAVASERLDELKRRGDESTAAVWEEIVGVLRLRLRTP